MNELDPRRWLLVSREFGIPGELDAAGRWAVDHLFLDQDAIPTLVEVKRSTDTRIRREVVGQMLDYASHLVSNVTAERIRQRFEASYDSEIEVTSQLSAVLGEEIDQEAYWQHLRDNIAAGKLRLVFVADEFPPELRRIVEFLNRQMVYTDVFAVEVRQFVDPNGPHRTLVPRLLGRVESKGGSGAGSGPGPRWDRKRFDAAIESEYPDLLPLVDDLLTFGVEVTDRNVEWGMGRERGSFTARLVTPSQRYSIFSVYTTSELSINIGWSQEYLAKVAPSLSEEVRETTSVIFGLQFSRATWEKSWPMIPLSTIAPKTSEFKQLVSEFVDRLKVASENTVGSGESASLPE
jgi:hypothetical protein